MLKRRRVSPGKKHVKNYSDSLSKKIKVIEENVYVDDL